VDILWGCSQGSWGNLLFIGNATVNLDEKGRFAIPTRYREGVQQICNCKLIATVAVNERGTGIEGCLWIYPVPAWEGLQEKIKTFSDLNKAGVKLKRFLIGYATECEMDSQGRVLLPELLRKFANLDKKMILVGQLNRFELWNEDAFNKALEDFKDNDDIEGLEALGDISF
jgi:MraZ protein